MKFRSLIIVLVILLAGSELMAQIRIHRPVLHACIGTMTYQGDYADELFSFGHGIAGGQGFSRYMTRSFDIGYEINFAYVKGDNSGPRRNPGILQNAFFSATMVNLDIFVKYKLTNDYLLKESSRFSPYILAGPGILYSNSTGSNSRRADFDDNVVALNVYAAPGVMFNINNKTGIFLQSMFIMPLTDRIDGWFPEIPANESYDFFLMTTIGVIFLPKY